MITNKKIYSYLLKLKPKFIAVDEASRFKEPDSQRSRAFYGGYIDEIFYPGLFQDCGYVVFMDGSPMPNRPMELWTPTFALDPKAIDCMDANEFGFRYCAPYLDDKGYWQFRGSAREEELKAKLTKNFMHVVSESELSHPERKRSILFINTQVMTSQTKTWEKKHLKQIKFSDLNEAQSVGDIAHHRRRLGEGKAHWVVNYVREKLENTNESILVFCWHREVADFIYAQFQKHKPFLVYGGVANKVREEAFQKFQSGGIRLGIGNILAMGRGHNLHRADRVVFAEYSWSDEVNKQAEKRASRKGRNKEYPVKCEYVVVPDSFDEVMLNSVMTKEKRVGKIIG
jgi:hypothetical protein